LTSNSMTAPSFPDAIAGRARLLMPQAWQR
jgi:hypothetical protein